MENNYFDFHFHPVFKKFISQYEAGYPTKRNAKDLLGIVTPTKDFMQILDGKFLHFLGSQSCLDQMKTGRFFLGVANIAALEYGFCAADDLMAFVLNSALTDPLDKEYFRLVKDGNISYYHLFLKELNLYSRLANIGSYKVDGAEAHINILSRKNNGTKPFDSYEGPTLAIAMEGGHNLNRNRINHKKEELDKPKEGNHDKMYTDFVANANSVLSPAQSLQHLFKAMWEEDMDLMYVTLTHLSNIWDTPLATHAYGMKMLKHDHFYPSGSGLTKDGEELIKAAYGMTIDGRKTPVLIDVKHMSLNSRLAFYDFRNANGFNDVPILATHMAVTGMRAGQWFYAVKKSAWDYDKHPGLKAFMVQPAVAAVEKSYDEFKRVDYPFNPWNINLMDDDIEAIYRSKGMIGLSVDIRVIGAVDMKSSEKDKKFDPKEYISNEEFNALSGRYPHPRGAAPLPEYNDTTDIVIDPEDGIEDDHQREIMNYALNILHVLGVAMSMDNPVADPWAHIVMGSDYDGMIDPLALALDCSKMKSIERRLADALPKAEKSYLHFRPLKNGGKILARMDDGKIDGDILDEKVRGILYENGHNFMKKWYEGQL